MKFVAFLLLDVCVGFAARLDDFGGSKMIQVSFVVKYIVDFRLGLLFSIVSESFLL